MKVRCPLCNHEQESNSKLKNITCSSCQKKFKNPFYNNTLPMKTNEKVSGPEETSSLFESEAENKTEAKKLKLEW